jgi:hypothetical protein
MSSTPFASTITSAIRLLERAEKLYRQNWAVIDPTKAQRLPGDYICPDPKRAYESGAEPMLSVEGLYRLDRHAILTVNDYDAVVLNTSNMLIADVDFEDPQFSEHGRGALSTADVLGNLRDLSKLDRYMREKYHEETDFASQSYRVYETCNGCRVICTSTPIINPSTDWTCTGYFWDLFMRFMQSDPEYIALC